MKKRIFRVGDKVKVVGMSKVTYAAGVKDELGTEKQFKSMIGRVYTVRGFDKYGNIELEPKRLNTVWGEPEFLELRARKPSPIPRVRLWAFADRPPSLSGRGAPEVSRFSCMLFLSVRGF